MSRTKCLKITIKSDPVMVESISDYLVGVLEAGVETGAKEELLFGTLNAYVERSEFTDIQIEEIVGEVSVYLAELATVFRVDRPIISSMVVEEEDWGKSWKKHFKPFDIVPGLVIAPTWEEYRAKPEELVIRMDPGLAFGTGHHATTSLTLEFLQEMLAESSDMTVLDVGTGTGILGMAAVLFGAREVQAIDNDTDAVLAAVENVRLNGLQSEMAVNGSTLVSLAGCYSVIVANIVHNVLITMVDDFARLTREGGVLIVSGLLTGQQVESITAKVEIQGFVLSEERIRGEWSAVKFCKTG